MDGSPRRLADGTTLAFAEQSLHSSFTVDSIPPPTVHFGYNPYDTQKSPSSSHSHPDMPSSKASPDSPAHPTQPDGHLQPERESHMEEGKTYPHLMPQPNNPQHQFRQTLQQAYGEHSETHIQLQQLGYFIPQQQTLLIPKDRDSGYGSQDDATSPQSGYDPVFGYHGLPLQSPSHSHNWTVSQPEPHANPSTVKQNSHRGIDIQKYRRPVEPGIEEHGAVARQKPSLSSSQSIPPQNKSFKIQWREEDQLGPHRQAKRQPSQEQPARQPQVPQTPTDIEVDAALTQHVEDMIEYGCVMTPMPHWLPPVLERLHQEHEECKRNNDDKDLKVRPGILQRITTEAHKEGWRKEPSNAKFEPMPNEWYKQLKADIGWRLAKRTQESKIVKFRETAQQKTPIQLPTPLEKDEKLESNVGQEDRQQGASALQLVMYSADFGAASTHWMEQQRQEKSLKRKIEDSQNESMAQSSAYANPEPGVQMKPGPRANLIKVAHDYPREYPTFVSPYDLDYSSPYYYCYPLPHLHNPDVPLVLLHGIVDGKERQSFGRLV